MRGTAKIKRVDAAELLAIDAELVHAGDRWTYLKRFVYTHDERDKTVPSKAFPEKALYRVIQRGLHEYPNIFMDKSRQIMITWLLAADLLYDILFLPNRRNGCGSQNEDKAIAIVSRAQFIYMQLFNRHFPGLPEPRWSRERPGTDTEIYIPSTNSIMAAVPQGGETWASLTWSTAFLDEISKQAEAFKAYQCALPAAERVICVGTPNGKEFSYQKMYGFDRGRQVGEKLIDTIDTQPRYREAEILEMTMAEFNACRFEDLVASIPGMRFWKMKIGDEVTPCLRVHYSADPDRRPGTAVGDAWKAKERPKYSKANWDREQEIDHNTYEGRPVIDNWDDTVFMRPLRYDPKVELVIPVDFGSEVACAAFMQRRKLDKFDFYQAHILREVVVRNGNTFVLADAIVKAIRDHFPEIWRTQNFICHPDPAGMQKTATTSSTSLNTDIKILQSKGLRCRTRKFGVGESARFVETLFTQCSPAGDPRILVDPSCEYLASCYRGGWHYPEALPGTSDNKPEKDGEFDHGGDITRHGLCNMFKIEEMDERAPIPIAVPVRARHTARVIASRRPNLSRWRVNRGIHG